jgi:hypothetical protein
MKTLLLLIVTFAFSTNAIAEIRWITITGDVLKEKKETPVESIQITGYTYSLETGLQQESLEGVSLAELKKALSKIEHAGSSMIVSIYSKDRLPTSELTEIMKELQKNPYFELLYLENGYGFADGWVHEGLKNKTKGANQAEVATP